MKNFYRVQGIDLRIRVDITNPKKVQLFEEFRGNPNHVRFIIIIIRHKESKMISDGNKITDKKVSKQWQ